MWDLQLQFKDKNCLFHEIMSDCAKVSGTLLNQDLALIKIFNSKFDSWYYILRLDF